MKKLPILLLLFAVAACKSQNNTGGVVNAVADSIAKTASADSVASPVAGAAHTDSITVSTDGIGDFKIGMNIQSVEKLLNRTLANVPPPKDQGNGYGDARDTVRGIDPDTISFQYKGVSYSLMFEQGWREDSTYATTVSRVISHSPLLRTPAGIGMGDSLSKITRVYDHNSLRFNADHLDAYARAWVGKRKSIVTVTPDDTGNIIVFYLVNKKVDAMRVDTRIVFFD